MSGTYIRPDMGSYTNSDGKSDLANQEAAHDTSLYDPSRHDNQIVAMYETNERAHLAQDELVQAGVPGGAIQVIDATGTGVAAPAQSGFWGSIRALFVPDEDANAYGHALNHGHAMLVVHPDGNMDRTQIIHILEGTEPVDFDAKLEQWRQAGYDYSAHPMTGDAIGAAAGMATSASSFDSETGTTSPPPVTPEAAWDDRQRIGRREPANAGRVRSYVADRPDHVPAQDGGGIAARATGEEAVLDGGSMGTGGDVTNATPGAGSSGTNAPRQ